nr:MAG TPA: hypothetical protein [Caudoviricetes sp.]
MNPCQKPKKRGLRGFQNPRGYPKKYKSARRIRTVWVSSHKFLKTF